jgi:hypothetical protein
MKKSLKSVSLILFIAAVMSSCYSISHTVGTGSSTGEIIKKKQWYILYGAVPLNKIDTKALAGNATNYTITTKHGFVDYLIGAVTGFVTIKPMTVVIKK